MIEMLSQVMLYVNNPKETMKFWVEKLSFIEKMKIDTSEFFMVELSPSKDAQTSIVLMDKSVIAKMSPELDLAMPSLMFQTNDIHTLYKMCKDQDIIVGDIVENAGRQTFNFADSEGNYYAVCQ